jgi:hypothetical protein
MEQTQPHKQEPQDVNPLKCSSDPRSYDRPLDAWIIREQVLKVLKLFDR